MTAVQPLAARSLSARSLGVLLGMLVAWALLGGCATTTGPAGQQARAPSSADPWESFNRKIYTFNDAVDAAVLKPVAEAYRKVVPELVRAGVNNFLGNLGDVWSMANHLLQGKVQTGVEMGLRVVANTTFGLGGLLDPASEMGLKRRSEDFGQTLGRWGLGSGPYLVLPFMGPSTLRDTAALTLDTQVSPSVWFEGSNAKLTVTVLGLVDLRAGLLSTTRMIDDVALDKYTFVREAFLARRLDAVYDGSPPLSKDDGDPGDSAPPPAAPAKR